MTIFDLRDRVHATDQATTFSGEWPDPKPLPQGLPAVEPFVPELLPPLLRPWITDIAERMQCPPDFPAAAAMIALGSVIGRRCAIRPKRQDDWTVVPNLWGAVIGRPGVLKSPAIAQALSPLRRLEAEAGEEYTAALRAHAARGIAQKLERKAKEEKAKRSFKNGTADLDEVAETLAALDEGTEPEPIRRRYIANDATVEKLGEILSTNPAGILVFRDELSAWLHSLERDGREGDRGFYLEAWNGLDPFTYDRIARGTIEIPAACVSVFGAIQPGPLTAYLSRAAFAGAGDDGLLQRLQVVVWPDVSGEWRNVDRWPDTPARKAAFDLFSQLAKISAGVVKARHDDFDPSGVPFLQFGDEAQEAFDAWRAEFERSLRTNTWHPAWEAYLAKHRKLIPALALICHLADGGSGPLTLEAFRRAEAWGEFLRSHAVRLYDGLLRPDLSAARTLGDHIRAGDLGTESALRDVYRRHWSGLTTREEARAAVEVLIDHDWIAEVPKPTPGRTATVYLVNPKLSALEP